jgi:ATP-dependent DNA helicase RecG
MSATPIPRTLAQTIYGDNVQLYSIKTKPNGRLPVRTGHFQDMNRVLNIVYSEVKKRGHQAYVVCPMIAPNEKVEGVDTAEETYEKYRRALEPYGITVGLVTGKTKKQDAAQILADFKENRLSVLISTTVIEVGVNVPNATCIVIHSAERFGLAQLHQLRGRVGRGSDQAYCILVSQDAQNPRLATMCAHTDGFKIAEMDLTLRGAGDFLGSQQSGTEKYLALALQYNKEYAHAQKAAKWILDNGADCALLDKAVQDHNDNVEGEMVC